MSIFSSFEPAILERIDGYWSNHFGCSPEELRGPETRVRRHGPELADHPGLYVFASGSAPLISLPPSWFDSLAGRAAGWSIDDVHDAARFAGALAPYTIERLVGPAFLGYTTVSRGVQATATTRPLDGADQALIDDLRGACTQTDWEHGGMDPEQGMLFGAFATSGELAAIAGYKLWSRGLAHVCVVARSTQRGHGFATLAVAAATTHALAAGHIPQYRTLESNAPSMAIGRKLGFRPYGFTVALYLRE